MVFVNDKKYACETCIKGHRSSTCNHTERPLFEIKKKGRPITQCEHCRELRKTKQVHVKCLCEGRDDAHVSHSIPAKKANRKGPPPCAAFPFGLPPSLSQPPSASASDSEDANGIKLKVTPQGPSCNCKSGASCECCTPRHLPRSKRSLTPPSSRPRTGDIRATAPMLQRPASDFGDANDLPYQSHYQRSLAGHPLVHGHGARSTHGTALFNPYGHAHTLHSRSHEMLNHDASSIQGSPSGYVYPVPPIESFDTMQQGFPSQVGGGDASVDGQRDSPLSSTRPFFSGLDSVDFGSVDVDAWLRQLGSEQGPSPTHPTASLYQPSGTLPVPPPLDVSRDLSQLQDQNCVSSSSEYGGILPFSGLDIDLNESAYLGSNGSPAGATSASGPGILNHPQPLPAHQLNAPSLLSSEPFSATSSSFSLFNYGSEGGPGPASASASSEGEPPAFAFDYIPTMHDPDFVVQPLSGLPPLSRSSSTGSHSSSRSRSSTGYAWTGTAGRAPGGINSSTNASDSSHLTPWSQSNGLGLTTEYPQSMEDSWSSSVPSLDNTTGLVKWPSLPRSALENRGRSRAVTQPQLVSPLPLPLSNPSLSI